MILGRRIAILTPTGRRNMRSLAILALLILLTGCARRSEAVALEREKFAAVYAAVLEQNEASRLAGLDSSRAANAVVHVLDSAGVSLEQMRQSLQAYQSDPAQWRDILQEATRQLEERSSRRLAP